MTQTLASIGQWARRGFRARVEAKLAGIDLVTTGSASLLRDVLGLVRDTRNLVLQVRASEVAQEQALAAIQGDLAGLDLPAEKQAEILAAIRARIVKVRAATASPPSGA